MGREKEPTLEDYAAGSMLGSSFVLTWGLILSTFQQPATAPLLFTVSYIVYSIGGGIASYLVSGRGDGRHLTIGLRVSIGAWILSMLFFKSLTPGSLIALLSSLFLGGIIGSLTRKIKDKKEIADVESK